MILSKSLNKEEFTSIGHAFKEIAASVELTDRVNGKTHLHYKYPAGFSPKFPNAVIRSFTSPGDFILDPFMGGGTSLIEALNLGRNSIGLDVNELAVFSTKLKTLKLNTKAVEEIENWFQLIQNYNPNELKSIPEEAAFYFGDVPKGLAKVIFKMTSETDKLEFESSRIFTRGVLLRATQLILDNKRFDPTVSDLYDRLNSNFDVMLEQSVNFHTNMKLHSGIGASIHWGDSREKSFTDKVLGKSPAIKAVVTSPPYPGVHILYNRWQYKGRREIALPYFIIRSSQNLTPSFFTMGNRHTKTGAELYFNSIRSVFTNIGEHLDPGTPVVQLVAFNDKRNQLEPFLEAMSNAGFIETKAHGASSSSDGRIWRDVPHRKWYNSLGTGTSHSSNEVALIHRKK